MGLRWFRVLFLSIIFLLILLNGNAWGATTTASKYLFKMDEKVDGDGFFSSYQNVTASNLQLHNDGHGSGSYDYEGKFDTQNEAEFNDETQEYSLVNDRRIDFNESVDFSFAPHTFSFGKTFQSAAYSSLGVEKTCIKNYGNNISMNARFDSLNILSKNISAGLYWKSTDESDDGLIARRTKDLGRTSLMVDTAFNGRAHIGSLEVNRPISRSNSKNQGLHNVISEIDEDYAGTYTLIMKMSHEYNHTYKAEDDDWLPCCSGGYLTMPTYYRKGSKGFGSDVKGVFDCTCFKPAEVMKH
jgi:hypothetical protein